MCFFGAVLLLPPVKQIQNRQLTPLKIIQKHSNLCLSAKPTSSQSQVLLSNCSDSADQYFIIDRTFQTSQQLMHATAPEVAEINHSNISLSDDPTNNQPFNKFFYAVPQFHGTITSESIPQFCLTLPASNTLTFGICRNNTLGTYPIQNFQYHDGYLTIRETAPC